MNDNTNTHNTQKKRCKRKRKPHGIRSYRIKIWIIRIFEKKKKEKKKQRKMYCVCKERIICALFFGVGNDRHSGTHRTELLNRILTIIIIIYYIYSILYYIWRYFNRGFTDTIWMWDLLLRKGTFKMNTDIYAWIAWLGLQISLNWLGNPYYK